MAKYTGVFVVFYTDSIGIQHSELKENEDDVLRLVCPDNVVDKVHFIHGDGRLYTYQLLLKGGRVCMEIEPQVRQG